MIEVEKISKIYGSTLALQDVSFKVEAGEILGFLGPNGAGKTTTMRILTGYLPASSGTARISGYDVHEDSMAVRQLIGYLPETPPLYPEMTVEAFLHFVARIKQVPAGDRVVRVEAALTKCGLQDKRKVLIRKLSKGFRQRVGIAQAIVHDPPVIILDEPTVGLDPRQIIEVRNLIKSLAGAHTVILSTHILPEVNMTCSQVAIINSGQVVAVGSLDNLMGEFSSSGYELELDGSPEQIENGLSATLQAVPGVESVETPQPLTTEGVTRYRLRLLCPPEAEPGKDIAAAVVASGLGLYEMRRTRASLEEVFLKLTTAVVVEGAAQETSLESFPDPTPETSDATQDSDSEVPPLTTPEAAPETSPELSAIPDESAASTPQSLEESNAADTNEHTEGASE